MAIMMNNICYLNGFMCMPHALPIGGHNNNMLIYVIIAMRYEAIQVTITLASCHHHFPPITEVINIIICT